MGEQMGYIGRNMRGVVSACERFAQLTGNQTVAVAMSKPSSDIVYKGYVLAQVAICNKSIL